MKSWTASRYLPRTSVRGVGPGTERGHRPAHEQPFTRTPPAHRLCPAESEGIVGALADGRIAGSRSTCRYSIFLTNKMRAVADHWRYADNSDEAVAGMIRADKIDILVDLALPTAPASAFPPKPLLGCLLSAGRSILNIGLPELIAETPERYIEIAVAVANDPPRLNELRSSLRERIERSLLRDATRHTRDVEAAYREMVWPNPVWVAKIEVASPFPSPRHSHSLPLSSTRVRSSSITHTIKANSAEVGQLVPTESLESNWSSLLSPSGLPFGSSHDP